MHAIGVEERHTPEQLKIIVRESSRTNHCNCKDASEQPLSSSAV